MSPSMQANVEWLRRELPGFDWTYIGGQYWTTPVEGDWFAGLLGIRESDSVTVWDGMYLGGRNGNIIPLQTIVDDGTGMRWREGERDLKEWSRQLASALEVYEVLGS